MGKMGARELNYSSDVDLIVFYDPAALVPGTEPAAFCVRLTRALVRLLQERTADGYVFRVDLRLRPDPASTQIAISTAAALDYYESRGQNWERAALIKATLETLDALVDGTWIDRHVRDELGAAYRFLRLLENRLQMVADEQTHTLPADRDGLQRFARFAAFADRDAFAQTLLVHLRNV